MGEVESIALLLFGGLSFRFALTLTGQNWAKTYQQTVAFLVLPFITYVITKTISGNIALSLGMIGAMSIVRFRNPVKSALELVMYFALITMGIAASVRTKWAIQLILVVVAVIFGMKIVQRIAKNFNKSFFNLSFNEGVSLHMLEIHSTEKIESIEKNENLKVQISHPDQNQFVYRLAFDNKKQLESVKEQLEKNKNIKKIDINYI
jgi:NhaP-type Na+/H+ or K+/H+ antiporter